MANSQNVFAICIAVGLACPLGCNRNVTSSDTDAAVTSLPVSTTELASPVETRWYACDERKAAKVLVTEVTIPSVCERSRRETFLYSDTPFDSDGRRKMRNLSIMTSYACGPGCSFHESVSLDWDDPPDSEHVVLKLYYFWLFSKEKREGSLDEKAKIRVGDPTRVTLENGAFVDVSWRDIAR